MCENSWGSKSLTKSQGLKLSFSRIVAIALKHFLIFREYLGYPFNQSYAMQWCSNVDKITHHT